MRKQQDGSNDCALNHLCSMLASRDAYKKNQSIFFSSHQEGSHNRTIAFELAILVMSIPTEPWRRWYRLVGISRAYWKRSHLCSHVVSRHLQSLNIERLHNYQTWSVALSFLTNLVSRNVITCWSLVIKGLIREDLIWAHLRRMSWSSFKSKEDWASCLNNL